jgi:hypothetical protein
MTSESVESGVRSVLLPDDDQSPTEHPYEWLSELLWQQDVDVSVEQLRRASYRIELSDRLEPEAGERASRRQGIRSYAVYGSRVRRRTRLSASPL